MQFIFPEAVQTDTLSSPSACDSHIFGAEPMNNPHVHFRPFLVFAAYAAMAGSCGVTLGLTDEIKDSNTEQLQTLLRTEGLDLISPERNAAGSDLHNDQMLPLPDWQGRQENNRRMMQLRTQRAQTTNQELLSKAIREQLDTLANQGNDVQALKELFEKLEHVLKTSENANTDEVAVAVFAVPEEPQQRPEENPKLTPPKPQHPAAGRPGFGPPLLMTQHRMQQHGPGPQIHRPETHQPAGPFAEDQKRIAALRDSAERLAHAGLPDAAHGLMERAGQIQRELAEKQERIQREEHERARARMREQQEQAHHQQRRIEERKTEEHRERNEHADRPALPVRELHEQLEQLRREVHSINEKVSHLTEMIELHHRAQEHRGHRNDMDDDDEKHDRDDDTPSEN